MSDQDPRPRPQYGEYATPEQQRAHIRQPVPEHVTPAPVTPTAPQQRPAAPAPVAQPVQPQRLVTIVLLALGAVNVLLSAFSFLSLSQTLPEILRAQGLPDDIADMDRGQGWGFAMAAALIVGYLLTLWITMRRLKARRSAWWIPVVGALVTWLVVCVLMAALLLSDPAIVSYMTTHTPTSTP
ncbi:DUF6264 family protein [Microbacterium gorillae]|uniref:DUF6264 family protein n=1 Tax=Microbacterium gorillae TaxID=1231063 RepID=UPI00058C1545|nr:DUF6264 family protein [Microbacterium gorillae]